MKDKLILDSLHWIIKNTQPIDGLEFREKGELLGRFEDETTEDGNGY